MGNHTVHHCNLRDGGGGSACPASRGRPAAFVTAELQDADAIIAGSPAGTRRRTGGRRTARWTRRWRRVAATAGYPYTILWSTDTIDWRTVADGGPTARASAAKVIAGRKAGAIVLMHLGGYETRNALPAMVRGCGRLVHADHDLGAVPHGPLTVGHAGDCPAGAPDRIPARRSRAAGQALTTHVLASMSGQPCLRLSNRIHRNPM